MVESPVAQGVPLPPDPYLEETARERDAQWRHAALSQAAHDCKGQFPADKVVERARSYYDFLRE